MHGSWRQLNRWMPTSPVRTAARSIGSASAICVFVEIALVPRQGRNLTLAALQLSSGPAEKEKREMNREPVDAFRAAGVIVMTIVVIFAMEIGRASCRERV